MPARYTHFVCVILIVFMLLFSSGVASAASRGKKDTADPCESYICIEADSGVVLSELNADEPRPPASMIKMMLLLMVSEGIEQGQWSLDTPITVSKHAEHMGGTQVYLRAGETETVGRLALAAAVASANDAAMALAEGLWGSEENYLKAMNARAQKLGMADSHFYSVHGLPPDHGTPADRTTARDMSILAQWCVRNPQVMNWVGHKELVFRPGEAKKFNTNKLLWRMDNCDGLKTGFTNAAGFCLTATAKRNGIRLISVLMGCTNKYRRFDLAKSLLTDGFGHLKRVAVLKAGQELDSTVRILNSEVRTVHPAVKSDLWVVAKANEVDRIKVVPSVPDHLEAPLQAGMVLGKVYATVDGQVRGAAPVVLDKDVHEAGWGWKLVQGALAHNAAAAKKGTD